MRFVSDLIFSLGEIFGTEIVILNPNEDGSFKEDLAQDVLEIITVVSAELLSRQFRYPDAHVSRIIEK